MNATHLKSHHKHVLEDIFRHPTAHNLDWNDVAGFLNHIGSVTERHNGTVSVSVGERQTTIARPHGKDLGSAEIRHLREFLLNAGFEPAGVTRSDSPGAETAPPGLQLIVVIDHHAARLFRMSKGTAEGANPVVLAPHDPHGFHRHLAHRKEANYEGERVPEDPEFYEKISAALSPAREILIIGHATGKSNAGDHLLEHLQKRHPETAQHVVGPITADLSHITDGEIMALSRSHLAI
jgi:hypothetical protein